MKKLIIALMALALVTTVVTGCTSSQRRDTGTVVGAVAGGVAGSALTHGSTAGTIAGAVGGGFVGRELSN